MFHTTKWFLAALAVSIPPARASAQMEMGGMPHRATLPLGIPDNRLGSGTSWLPDAAPMRAIHTRVGGWTAMAHGSVSLLLDAQGGSRGATEVRLVNWGMGTLAHTVAGGRLELRAMLSAEPATVGSNGYPLLLQSGESNHGIALHDRQHPHDLFMETALLYDRAIGGTAAASLYLAPAGEPALGPPAYPHRPSAAWDPLAPIGHHWQDGAHVTYGVITTGIYTRAVKVEASAFNGREPDENRTGFDYRGRRLDSYSGRTIVNPAPGLSVSAWYGYLRSPEALEPAQSMHRVGAAVLASGGGAARWSSALVFGANVPLGAHRWSNSALVEGSVDLGRASTVFARLEYVQKSAADLAVPGAATVRFDLGELSLGYFRTVRQHAGVVLGIGARGSLNLVPPSLRDSYGSRMPVGVAVCVSLRPGERVAHDGGQKME